MINLLGLGDPVLLFHAHEMHNLTERKLGEAVYETQQISADTFLNTPTEDIIAALTEKHSLESPVLKRDKAYIDGPHEIKLRRSDYGREFRATRDTPWLDRPLRRRRGYVPCEPQ